jgi:hypothetical protein
MPRSTLNFSPGSEKVAAVNAGTIPGINPRPLARCGERCRTCRWRCRLDRSSGKNPNGGKVEDIGQVRGGIAPAEIVDIERIDNRACIVSSSRPCVIAEYGEAIAEAFLEVDLERLIAGIEIGGIQVDAAEVGVDAAGLRVGFTGGPAGGHIGSDLRGLCR